MNTASTRTHKFTDLMAKATHISCKISGLLRRHQTIRRSVQLLGDAHAPPIDDRRRTPSVLALTILSNNDWHYKQVQYEHANTNLRAKGLYVRSKPWCCVAANAFPGKVPNSLQIRDLERTSCTHAQRVPLSLNPLWVLCSNSKHSWRKAANTNSIN